MFRGSMPALVTPFKDGSVDFSALGELVEWQIESGRQRAGADGDNRGEPDG